MRVLVSLTLPIFVVAASGCCDDTKQECPVPAAHLCPDTDIVGTWVPEGFPGTQIYNGTSYSDDPTVDNLTECQSDDYGFTLSVDGWHVAGYSNTTLLWGSVYSTGTMDVKARFSDTSFSYLPASDFVAFAGQPGYAQLICDGQGGIWECDWDSDPNFLTSFGVTITLDATDPDVAWMTPSLGSLFAFVGDNASGTFSCNAVDMQVESIKLVRISQLGSSPIAIAEGDDVYECVNPDPEVGDTGDTDPGDTGETTPPPAAPPQYQGLTPGEWLRFVVDSEWNDFVEADPIAQHAQATAFLNEYLFPEDIQRVGPFVHFCVDKFENDQNFHTMVTTSVSAVQSGSPEVVEMTAEFAANGFMQTFGAWNNMRNQLPGNNPPPPPPAQP